MGPYRARAASNRALWRKRLVAFTVFRSPRGAPGPCRAPHPTEPSGESVYSGVYSLPEPRRSRAHAPHPTEPSGESVCWRLQSAGAAAEPWDNIARARAPHPTEPSGESVSWRLQSSGAAAEPCWDHRAPPPTKPSAMERALSGVYSLPEPPRSPAGTFSRAPHPTEPFGESVQSRLESSGAAGELSCCGVLCCSVLCCRVVVCCVVLCCAVLCAGCCGWASVG